MVFDLVVYVHMEMTYQRLTSRLTDAAPIAFNLKPERHRGIRCSRLLGALLIRSRLEYPVRVLFPRWRVVPRSIRSRFYIDCRAPRHSSETTARTTRNVAPWLGGESCIISKSGGITAIFIATWPRHLFLPPPNNGLQ